MGCGSSSAGKVDDDNNKQGNDKNGTNNNKKKQNIKIEITEDPEQQGEKFHLEEKGNGEDDNNEEKEGDSFDEF